jgi:hypothetical protein
MKALLRFVPPRAALPPLAELLVAGGDARLKLEPPSALNRYGCGPTPRLGGVSYASSTASSISERGLRRAQDIWHRLADAGCDALVEEARGELAHLLGLGASGAAIVFAPSGTDAALAALGVARALDDRPLVTILAAADETGSGARHACAGRHFSPLTARGRAVVAGETVAGLGESVTALALNLRDAGGALREADEIDREMVTVVARAVAGGDRVLLFAMDHSKLGHRSPSAECLDQIRGRFGASVQIVLDACQARIGTSRLRRHLDCGDMVLITGSKFFTGPPLSGALLVPPALGERLEEAAGWPAGLGDYAVAGDFPPSWRGVRAAFGGFENPGQLLRWGAALAEMRAYLAQPLCERLIALDEFAGAVAATMASFEELIPLAERAEHLAADEEFPPRTIFPFLVRKGASVLSVESCAALCRALNRDVSGVLPATLSRRERELAALPCHIGQPVAIGGGRARGALRISASARLIGETALPGPRIALVLEKLRLLLRHHDAIARAF